jgi:hypothetical protein
MMMLSSFGRWRLPVLRQDVAKNTWGISLQPQYVLRDIQSSFKHFYGDDSRANDRRPPGVRLAAAILDSDPDSLFGAAGDSRLAKESREEVFEALSLRLPNTLPDSYKNAKDYHVKMQQLVVEEAWFAVTTALHEFKSKKSKRSLRKTA